MTEHQIETSFLNCVHISCDLRDNHGLMPPKIDRNFCRGLLYTMKTQEMRPLEEN